MAINKGGASLLIKPGEVPLSLLRTICGSVLITACAWSTVASAATVAYYRFENGVAGATASGNGSILDSSPNALNGTPSGGPTYSANRPATAFDNTLSMDAAAALFA